MFPLDKKKAVYVFDRQTHELIEKLNSVRRALKYAKVNFYTLKSLIESGISFLGKNTAIKINYNLYNAYFFYKKTNATLFRSIGNA